MPRATGVEPQRTDDDQLMLTFWVAAELKAAFEGWIQQLEQIGWRLLDRGGADWRCFASFERPGGGRAATEFHTLWGDKVYGVLLLVPPTAPITLAGPCVPVPNRSFEIGIHASSIGHEGRIHRSDIRHVYYTVRWWDLDGDAIFDAAVPVRPPAHACPDELEHDLYIMRGRCGHRVGRIVAWPQQPNIMHRTAVGPGGLKSISTGAQRFDGHDMHTTEREYVYERGRYRLVRETTRRGRCHHCAITTCHGPHAVGSL